jgi:hypothetical protein
MEADQLPADWTLRPYWMKPPPANDLDEFNKPYGEVPHILLPADATLLPHS